jgi:8-oxo-dGTP pyrophosphatase MutT (NUDIX family)
MASHTPSTAAAATTIVAALTETKSSAPTFPPFASPSGISGGISGDVKISRLSIAREGGAEEEQKEKTVPCFWSVSGGGELGSGVVIELDDAANRFVDRRGAIAELERLLDTHVAEKRHLPNPKPAFVIYVPYHWLRARPIVEEALTITYGLEWHHSYREASSAAAERIECYILKNGQTIPEYTGLQSVVTVLVTDPTDTLVLLAEHRLRPGVLALFAGCARHGEDPRAAAAREASQQAGLDPPLAADGAMALGYWINHRARWSKREHLPEINLHYALRSHTVDVKVGGKDGSDANEGPSKDVIALRWVPLRLIANQYGASATSVLKSASASLEPGMRETSTAVVTSECVYV